MPSTTPPRRLCALSWLAASGMDWLIRFNIFHPGYLLMVARAMLIDNLPTEVAWVWWLLSFGRIVADSLATLQAIRLLFDALVRRRRNPEAKPSSDSKK